MSELRAVIGALQSEVEFEAVVGELGAAGIDRARISFLAQEDIAASCAGAVGCDIKQLPRGAISLSYDRQQVRTLATSLAATVASFAGAGAVLAGTGAFSVIMLGDRPELEPHPGCLSDVRAAGICKKW